MSSPTQHPHRTNRRGSSSSVVYNKSNEKFSNQLFSCQCISKFSKGAAAVKIFSNYNTNVVVTGVDRSLQTLHMFGQNDKDQLGTGHPEAFRSCPSEIKIAKARTRKRRYEGDGSVRVVSPGIAQVAIGGEHTLVLTDEGRVLVTGMGCAVPPNMYISRGFRDLSISRKRRVTAVAAGRFHSLLMTDRGDVFAMGDNAKGQLGVKGVSRLSQWEKVKTLSREKEVKSIYAGEYQSFALTVTQDVWA